MSANLQKLKSVNVLASSRCRWLDAITKAADHQAVCEQQLFFWPESENIKLALNKAM